jgi:hypothetical protein
MPNGSTQNGQSVSFTYAKAVVGTLSEKPVNVTVTDTYLVIR